MTIPGVSALYSAALVTTDSFNRYPRDPMAKSVHLPSKTFATRTAALQFCRNLHNSKYSPGETISDPEDIAVLRDLVSLHPRADEKIGSGIADFYVDYTSAGDRPHVRHGVTGIWIRDTDGSSRDFSYTTAIQQPTEQAIVKEALRNEVATLREQLREAAFAQGPVLCPRTSITMHSWDEAQVVYETPDWATLTASFASSVGGWDQLETSAGDGSVQIGRTLRDRNLAELWIRYWQDNAHPLIVSKESLDN